MAQNLLRFVLLAQGSYYFITAVWPLAHMRSFLAVTGPKTDLWLMGTAFPEGLMMMACRLRAFFAECGASFLWKMRDGLLGFGCGRCFFDVHARGRLLFCSGHFLGFLFPTSGFSAFAAAFLRGRFVLFFPLARAAFLSATARLVHRRPRPAFSLFLRNPLLFIPLLDMLSLAFLFAGMARFVSFWHMLSGFRK